MLASRAGIDPRNATSRAAKVASCQEAWRDLPFSILRDEAKGQAPVAALPGCSGAGFTRVPARILLGTATITTWLSFLAYIVVTKEWPIG